MLLRPDDRVRVGPLAREVDRPQRPRGRTSSDELALRVFALDARKAVGAVKKLLTLCSEITRQKVPASGVPTGLPSKTIVVLPWISGA